MPLPPGAPARRSWLVKKAKQAMAMAPMPAPDDTRRAGAILLAAGRDPAGPGSFDPFWAPLAGLPLLAHSVAAFERTPDIAGIVLVVAPDRLPVADALAAAAGWQRTRAIAALSVRLTETLCVALAALPPDITWIVVHDAARPLVTTEMIAAGLAAVGARPVAVPVLQSVGALPAAPAVAAAASISVNETLKRVQNGLVVETPPRPKLALLQSPQVFSRAALHNAFDAAPANLDAPDAATLAVAAGLRVALFPGSPANIRVTTPADLVLAEAFLNPR